MIKLSTLIKHKVTFRVFAGNEPDRKLILLSLKRHGLRWSSGKDPMYVGPCYLSPMTIGVQTSISYHYRQPAEYSIMIINGRMSHRETHKITQIDWNN